MPKWSLTVWRYAITILHGHVTVVDKDLCIARFIDTAHWVMASLHRLGHDNSS